MNQNHPVKVSIVIPHTGRLSALRNLLEELNYQSDFIYEIIIACSARNKAAESLFKSSSNYVGLCQNTSKKQYRKIQFEQLKIVMVKFAIRLNPGHARNVGIQLARAAVIGFLDSNTLPSRSWLKSSLENLYINHYDVALGSTLYQSRSKVGRVILASTYGFNPLASIPGTLVKCDRLSMVGAFLPNVRAAEDIDFISRLEAFELKIYRSVKPTTYYKLQSTNPTYYFYKWFRNYSVCAPYVSLTLQSFVLTLMLAFIILLIGYLWNWNVAGWRTDSVLYMPNLTKSLIILLALIYCACRGYVMPRSKAAFSRGNCNIIDIPFILAFSASLDLSKALAICNRIRFYIAK